MATAETTQEVRPAASEPTMDQWRQEVINVWLKRLDAKGPEAFRTYIRLASTFANTACTATCHQDPDTKKWVDEAGIDPLMAELAHTATNLLRLIEQTLAGQKVRP